MGHCRICVIVCVGWGGVFSRCHVAQAEKDIRRKDVLFIHTAHDVRTPLTLIKAPLEEVVEKDMVKAEGMDNVRMALKSVTDFWDWSPA